MKIGEFLKKQNEIDKALIHLYGDKCNIDGVSDPEKYLNSSPKIMFVLKESNDYDGCMRKLHANGEICKYKWWKRTYARIIYVTYGVYHGFLRKNKMGYIGKDGAIGGKYLLDGIAFINLKKISGKGTADYKKVNEEYLKVKDIIKSQIEYLNPDIIINCSRNPAFSWDVAGGMEYKDENKSCIFKYAIKNNRLIIDAYHPNARNVTHESYVEAILEIISTKYK